MIATGAAGVGAEDEGDEADTGEDEITEAGAWAALPRLRSRSWASERTVAMATAIAGSVMNALLPR
jgi:hypothetical protein